MNVSDRRSATLVLVVSGGLTLVLTLVASVGAVPASAVESLWALALAVLIIGMCIAFAQHSRAHDAMRPLTAAGAVFAFVAGATALLVLLGRAFIVDLASPFPWFAVSGLSVFAWPTSLRWFGRMQGREAFVLGVSLAPITFVLQLGLLLLVSRFSPLG